MLLLLPGSLAKTGDMHFETMSYEEAIAAYELVLREDLEQADILWRLARAHIALGETAPDNERVSIYRKAESYARRCITADSMVAEGHTWLAASLGNIALFSEKRDQLRLAWEMKEELEIAVSLRQDDDATYSIMGSFNHALGNVGWFERQLATIFLGPVPDGSYEEAEAAFGRAIELAPDVMRHRYELGLLLLDWDREEEAHDIFRFALQLPIKVAGDTVAQKRMREVLGGNGRQSE
jgi:tetratricopeptide (TPR) repeat protein